MSGEPRTLFRRRCLILYLFFAVPVFLIAVQLVRYTMLEKEKNAFAAKQIAWRKGQIPVLRGRILDCDGKILAWTELQFNCILKKLPRNPSRRKVLAEKIGCSVEQLRQDMIVESSVPSDKVLAKKEELRYYPELQMVTRFVRHTLPDAGLQEKTGQCKINEDGVLTGISGWEKEYEETLSGTPGEFHVMLDRWSSWLPETMKIIRPGVPGRDVTVDFSLEKYTGEMQDHEK